jgi:hypothetical protein
MNVIVYVRDLMGEFGPICSWDDWESRDQAEAADRAWWITNDHIGNLTGWQLEARQEFELAAQGLTLGIGDWVNVEGEVFVCTSEGMEPADVEWEEPEY